MADIRIFSYLPNPRVWKATIAARLTGVEVECIGARPPELGNWYWDFEAFEMTDADRAARAEDFRQSHTGFSGGLYKSDGFLTAHPFGTVPAAFSPDGTVGIFESNSIARTVARLGKDGPALYGTDPYAASRIDSFLDVSLVFARDGQNYLLALSGDRLTREIYDSAKKAFQTYMGGIESALRSGDGYIVGAAITLADICFVAEYCSFCREAAHLDRLADFGVEAIVDEDVATTYPQALAHFDRLRMQPAFAEDMENFWQKLEAKRQAA